MGKAVGMPSAPPVGLLSLEGMVWAGGASWTLRGMSATPALRDSPLHHLLPPLSVPGTRGARETLGADAGSSLTRLQGWSLQ